MADREHHSVLRCSFAASFVFVAPEQCWSRLRRPNRRCARASSLPRSGVTVAARRERKLLTGRALHDVRATPDGPTPGNPRRTTMDHGPTGSARRWHGAHPSVPLRLFAQHNVAPRAS